jgi:hypothetical protein
MPLIQKRLVGPSTLTASNADYYTVPQNTVTIIKEIILCNYSASTRTVKLYCKPAGETLSSSHIFFSDISISADETLSLSTSLVLNNNGSTAGASNSDQIVAVCDAGASVNLIINGIEES